ncbi:MULTISPECIES: CoA pyrophosphatase [unclassified Agarivorans]|uniref:CoA pyrophosphatase n=1 Tax=unclassified Agarivorans TaxID=2636026 RepID=UPI003D7E6A87
MHTHHYLQRYLLHPAVANSAKSTKQAAAVLVPIIAQPGQTEQLVLTQRSAQLRHHPSEISFPGGKYDSTDHNLQHTALRETEEEIGINPKLFTILGQLPQLNTVSNFSVSPFIATAKQDLAFKINDNEVAQVIVLPLQPFLSLSNYQGYRFYRKGRVKQVYFIEVEKHVIWGATAQILYNLASHCCG